MWQKLVLLVIVTGISAPLAADSDAWQQPSNNNRIIAQQKAADFQDKNAISTASIRERLEALESLRDVLRPEEYEERRRVIVGEIV